MEFKKILPAKITIHSISMLSNDEKNYFNALKKYNIDKEHFENYRNIIIDKDVIRIGYLIYNVEQNNRIKICQHNI